MYAQYFHRSSCEFDMFYSYFNKINTVLWYSSDNITVYYNKKIQRLFVKKFYHERRCKIVLKTLKFIGVYDTIDREGFSITRLGEKRKLNMAEPIETIIICAQQKFQVARGLNPVRIETEDDRILNILKRYKNVQYKITPRDLLFPASIKNDTKQILVTGKQINGVKNSI